MNEENEAPKLINCPHCGKEVSTIANANTCPYCHNKLNSQFKQSQEDLPQPEKKKKLKTILSYSYLLISLLIIGILMNNLSILNSQNHTLRKNIESYEKDIDSYDSENKSLKNQIAELEDYKSKYNQLNSQINNYQDQQATIDDLNAQVTNLQSQYDSLLAERDSLQQQVDAKQAAAEQAARKAQEEQYSNDVSGTVYWVSGGECYHSTPDCATLKRSSNITSGSISQAGGRRPCKVCH